jgi:hypothetical protein
VGATHTQSATVLCADGKASANAAVTVAIAAPVGSLNSNLTLNGTTDAAGKVAVTWSRANPDTDSVDVFPTAQPNIRATATIFWVVKPVISCTPTTSGTVINGQNRIFTVTVRKPDTGETVPAGTVVSVGVAQDVTKGTATINGTAVDTSASASNTAGKQLLTATTDANGNTTLTVSGTNTTLAAVVWLEATAFGGNADTTLDNFEFQATCGTTTFQAVQAVTLTVSPSTAATVAQSAQRIFTVSATDSAGNPTAATVNIGFAENLLSTVGTSARITWFDIETAAADQRGSAASSSSSARQSVCNRVPGGTWNARTGAGGTNTVVTTDTQGNVIVNEIGAIKRDEILGTSTSGTYSSFGVTSTYPRIAANITLPAVGRATFAICDEVAADTATPLVWQDLNASPDFIPETGEPQAQGGVTTFATPVLTTGILFAQSTGGSSTRAATGSADDTTASGLANTQQGLGLEQFTFRIRNQSRNGFFPPLATGQTAGSCTGNTPGTCPVTGTNVGNTVIWTVQNTGSANVFIIDFDGSGTALPQTVAPGTSVQVQSPILASGTDCTPGGRDMGGVNIWSLGGAGEYNAALGTQVDCFDSANILLNAGAATSAAITSTLVSNGAMTGSSTITWINAVAEPTNVAGVGFTAQGTVLQVDTNGWNGSVTAPSCAQGNSFNNLYGAFCYYLLQTTSGTVYKINFGGANAGGAAHTTDTYIYLGTQFAGAPTCMGVTPCSPAGTLGPLAQFLGVASSGNKITYTNGLNNTATSPSTGNAKHEITATQ